jgi:3-isopropylmalate/(R)-2-methylmalate dehydratase large subunit
MTLSEKILCRAVGGRALRSGEFLEIEPDLGLANDITAPIAIHEFEKTAEAVGLPERIWRLPDPVTAVAPETPILPMRVMRHRGWMPYLVARHGRDA